MVDVLLAHHAHQRLQGFKALTLLFGEEHRAAQRAVHQAVLTECLHAGYELSYDDCIARMYEHLGDGAL